MPHLITNMGARQTHPLYKTKQSKEPGPMGKKGPDKGPEKNRTHPEDLRRHQDSCWSGHEAESTKVKTIF